MDNLFGNWSFFSKQKKNKNTTKKQQKKGILSAKQKIRYAAVAQATVHGMDNYLIKYLESIKALVNTKPIERAYIAQYKKYYDDFVESLHAVKEKAQKHKKSILPLLTIFAVGGVVLYYGIQKSYRFIKQQTERFWKMVKHVSNPIIQVASQVWDFTKRFTRNVFGFEIDIKGWGQTIGRATVDFFNELLGFVLDGLCYLFCDDTGVSFVGELLDEVAIAAFNLSFETSWRLIIGLFFNRVQHAKKRADASVLAKYGVEAHANIARTEAQFNSIYSNTNVWSGYVESQVDFGALVLTPFILLRDAKRGALDWFARQVGFQDRTKMYPWLAGVGMILAFGEGIENIFIDEDLTSGQVISKIYSEAGIVKMEQDAGFGMRIDGDAAAWRKNIQQHSRRMRQNMIAGAIGDSYNLYQDGQYKVSDDVGKFKQSAFQEQAGWWENARQFNPNEALYTPEKQDLEFGLPSAGALIKKVDDFMLKYKDQKHHILDKLRRKWASLRAEIMRTYQDGYLPYTQTQDDKIKGNITYRQMRAIEALLYECYVWQGKTLERRMKLRDLFLHNRIETSVLDIMLATQDDLLSKIENATPLEQMVKNYMGYKITFKQFMIQAIELIQDVEKYIKEVPQKDIDRSYGRAGAKLFTKQQFNKKFGANWIKEYAYKARNYFKRLYYVHQGWETVVLYNELLGNYSIGTGKDGKVLGSYDEYSNKRTSGVRQAGDETIFDGRSDKQLLVFAIGNIIDSNGDILRAQAELRTNTNKKIKTCATMLRDVVCTWASDRAKDLSVMITDKNWTQVQMQYNKKIQRPKKLDIQHNLPEKGSDSQPWADEEGKIRKNNCNALKIQYVDVKRVK